MIDAKISKPFPRGFFSSLNEKKLEFLMNFSVYSALVDFHTSKVDHLQLKLMYKNPAVCRGVAPDRHDRLYEAGLSLLFASQNYTWFHSETS